MLSSLGIIARILNSLGGSARILNGLGANARIDAYGKITDPELKRFAQQFGYNRKNWKPPDLLRYLAQRDAEKLQTLN